jgi:hypothetical protein
VASDPTRATLLLRLDSWEQHRVANPGYAIAAPTLYELAEVTVVRDALRAALAATEPSETNTLADRLNAASYDIEQHAPASEYATRAQVALADLRLWLTTEGAYPQVAPAPTDEDVARWRTFSEDAFVSTNEDGEVFVGAYLAEDVGSLEGATEDERVELNGDKPRFLGRLIGTEAVTRLWDAAVNAARERARGATDDR